MNTTETTRGWLPISCAPVKWLILGPGGTCQIGDRSFPPDAPMTVRVKGTKVRKPPGVGQPIRLIALKGEAVIRYRNEAWQRYPLPPELDPFPYHSVDPLAPCAEPAAVATAVQPTQVSPATIAPATIALPAPSAPVPEWPVRSVTVAGRALLRGARSVALTTVLVLGTVAASLAAVGTPAGPSAGWVLSPTDFAAGWDVRCLAHAVVNLTPAELFIWVVGLAVFGLFVERNGGTARATAVALAGALGGIGGYVLFNTPAGQAVLDDLVLRMYLEIVKLCGIGYAQGFATAVSWLVPNCEWSGAVSGSAGVVGALIAYAVVRRKLASEDAVTIRPLKFVVAVAFLVGAIGYAWPTWVTGPFPFAMLFGGFAGGLAVIFPEKVLKWLGDKMVEAWQENWSS